MTGRSMPKRRITTRVATRPGGNVGCTAWLGAGRVIVESNVGSGAYEARGRLSGGWSTALVYDSRPLPSSATPTAVSNAGSRRNRSRFQTVFTAGSLAKDPGALGRPEVPAGGVPQPGRALALRASAHAPSSALAFRARAAFARAAARRQESGRPGGLARR